jgi:signal transduction histidine kinase
MERLDVNRVVEATLGVTEHALMDVKVSRGLTPNLPLVDGNANQLQQVFTNIVINAGKAMSKGGTLFVETRAENGHVHIAFRDTGVGMPKAVIARVFEPFFTTRKVGEGTGLGLSVSYGLVKAHGGEIHVESEEGRGTTFTVILPASP